MRTRERRENTLHLPVVQLKKQMARAGLFGPWNQSFGSSALSREGDETSICWVIKLELLEIEHEA